MFYLKIKQVQSIIGFLILDMIAPLLTMRALSTPVSMEIITIFIIRESHLRPSVLEEDI